MTNELMLSLSTISAGGGMGQVFSWESIVGFYESIFWTPENISPWIIMTKAILLICLFNGLLMFKHRVMLYDVDDGFGLRTTRDPNTIPPWGRFCLWDFLPECKFTTTLLIGGYCVASFLALIGYLSWWPLAAMYLIDISRIHRNLTCNHAGDTYNRLITLCIMFALMLAPNANAFGLDYYLEHGSAANFGLDLDWSPWPVRLVMALWISCYLNATIHKLKGVWWRNGTAAFYPLYLNGFRRWPMPYFMITPFWTKVATWGTLVIEGAAILAVNDELRPYVVIGMVLMHLIFDYLINIQLFSWFMITSAACWIFPETAHKIMLWVVALF